MATATMKEKRAVHKLKCRRTHWYVTFTNETIEKPTNVAVYNSSIYRRTHWYVTFTNETLEKSTNVTVYNSSIYIEEHTDMLPLAMKL